MERVKEQLNGRKLEGDPYENHGFLGKNEMKIGGALALIGAGTLFSDKKSPSTWKKVFSVSLLAVGGAMLLDKFTGGKGVGWLESEIWRRQAKNAAHSFG